MKRTDCYPGWKMSRAQHLMYFNLLGQVSAFLKLTTAAAKEEQRQLIHRRAFGRHGVSAKEIDHMRMFDAFKAECLAWLKPADLGAQLTQVDQPLIRLRHRILEFPEAYVRGLLLSPRFKKNSMQEDDLETILKTLSEKELTDLRNTLCARAPQAATPDTEPEAELVPAADGDPF